MYKLEMKTKHQNNTQSHKKRRMQQQSTTFSGHHHRQKNKTLAGRQNLAGRPSSPVTIIARKKQKKNQNPFLLHRRPAKPNRQTTISGQNPA
jgi:hypothetical protein